MSQGLFTWGEEDPRLPRIDHLSAICFPYAVYMQKVVLDPSHAWVVLEIGSS